MENHSKHLDFFLGVSSNTGFVSYFSEITDYKKDWINYIIKGGPGSGKSTMMKKIFDDISQQSNSIERIFCSSDPSSLDGVISDKFKITIADGTPPHTMEPQYPGMFETIINLLDFFDNKKLRSQSEQILEAFKENKDYHIRATKLISSINNLNSDNIEIAKKCTNLSKIRKLAQTISYKYFRKAKKTNLSIEKNRILSAITPQGIVTHINTAKNLAENIYIIKDEIGVCSSLLLKEIRKHAIKNNLDIYTCHSPINPIKKIDHIFIPSLNLGFMTEDKYNNLSSIIPYRSINFTRFTDIEKLKNYKKIITSNRKTISSLIEETISSLKTAKIIHDKMEDFYINAIDFTKVQQKATQISNDILNRTFDLSII